MTPETLMLEPRDWVPNNPRLPVLLYRRALQAHGGASAETAERLFAEAGWPPAWRASIFDYHHYHTNTHEALAIAAGSGRVILGGPGGAEMALEAGDVAVLPVGTGHKRIAADADFLVVGAYPPGCSPDLWTQAPDDAARARMEALPVPEADPAEGAGGPLVSLWGGG